jgi:hypothetical protein
MALDFFPFFGGVDSTEGMLNFVLLELRSRRFLII